ncbi:ATPase AAA [Psychrobacter glaciei]|uniref:ATPase AAA n=1 Tax=Psychrobacter glaciei TaxID=619771 RepID=A0ABQ3GTU3_9GAMM|nr:P-loop NTPase fold protein [Psychrobacter glaciei]GHD36085.1 ATPase AAA [Psychrobacter glaciei]
MTDYSVMKELTFSSRDEFTRKPIAEKIIKLLDSDIDVSPLIIDGKWGTGKTEFCFKLKNLIEADNPNNYKVGYVNAFQADHANEPLLTLIAEVASFYDEKDDKRKNFIKNAVPYLRLISGIGLKAGLGFAFGRYAVDIPDALADGMEEIKDGSKSLIDQSLESMIKDQVEAEKNLSTLRDALSDIASTNPIILLIDELDRCRPDFAVMMLETIKHVFDVDNVQIILITNAEQLKATIKHSYGSETNSHDYLYKFFKYQINLPTSTKDIEGRSVENNVTYFKATVQASKVIPQDFKENQFIYEIPTFLNVGKLSLRNIEQIVRCIETLIIFEDKEQSKSRIVEQILMVFLSFVYMIDKGIFQEIISKEINEDRFMKFINSPEMYFQDRTPRAQEFQTKSIILIIFSKYLPENCFYLPDDYLKFERAVKIISDFLLKYQFHNETNNLVNGKNNNSYIYKYIEHTINNLQLFEIVK